VSALKERLAAMANQHSQNDDIKGDTLRLLLEDNTTVLQDDTSLSEYELKADDAVLHVVYQLDDNEWESVDIISTAMQDVAT
jgi:hypothetical protein